MDQLRTVDELEELLGEQVRRARIALDLEQAELARLANVSVRALRNLERGHGSSVSTLVAVVRALDKTAWLVGLAPAVQVSPMQMLRASRRSAVRTRVRHPADREADR